MSPQHNQNQGRGGGRGRRGGGHQPPKCSKCLLHDVRKHNPNVVPKGRQYCLECVPELIIKVDGQVGKDAFEVTVRTFENGTPKRLAFSYAVEGGSWTTTHTNDSSTTLLNGTEIVKIPYTDKKRTAVFLLEGSPDTQAIEIPADPAKKKAEDEAKPVSREIVVAVTRQRANVEVLVQTLENGKLKKLPFFYCVDRQNFCIDETADGSSPSEPLGTAVIELESHTRPRKARFWVVGNPNAQEIVIEANPGEFQETEIPANAEVEFTGDVTVVGNEYHILVQTYVDKVQIGLRFCYQVNGQAPQFDFTSDGTIGHVPRGTKILKLPASPKAGTLDLQLIGRNVDVRKLVLPAVPVKPKNTTADHNLSAGENFIRALLGR